MLDGLPPATRADYLRFVALVDESRLRRGQDAADPSVAGLLNRADAVGRAVSAAVPPGHPAGDEVRRWLAWVNERRPPGSAPDAAADDIFGAASPAGHDGARLFIHERPWGDSAMVTIDYVIRPSVHLDEQAYFALLGDMLEATYSLSAGKYVLLEDGRLVCRLDVGDCGGSIDPSAVTPDGLEEAAWLARALGEQYAARIAGVV